MSENSMVSIKGLSVVLGDNFTALENINEELPKGIIIGLIGPSGAGKTTLMRTIVGRQKITTGTIEVLGLPAGSTKLRPQISYMTQEISIYADLTIEQNLGYFATMRNLSRSEVKATITRLLEITRLTNHAKQLVGRLSGGEKQRVSLAVSLIGQPQLMVLDEPTVGLDPVLREEIWRLFHELANGGTTLLVSSHVMDEAERCDDLLLIRDGKILAHASPKGLCDQTDTQTVEQSFLKLVGVRQ